jgi:hypothetical protein
MHAEHKHYLLSQHQVLTRQLLCLKALPEQAPLGGTQELAGMQEHL